MNSFLGYDKGKTAGLINSFVAWATHSTSTGELWRSFKCVCSHIIESESQTMDKSVCKPSQKIMAPIRHLPNHSMHNWPGQELNQKPRLAMHLTSDASDSTAPTRRCLLSYKNEEVLSVCTFFQFFSIISKV